MNLKKKFLKIRDEIKLLNESYYNSQSQISDADFDKLKHEYEDFIKNNPSSIFRIIDITDRDFIENRQDYLWLLGEIKE